MQKEKVRVYALAKMLNVESKKLLDMCQEMGFDVKNQLSGLEPEQRDALEQRLKGGGGVATLAPPKPVTPPRVDDKKIKVLDAPRRPSAGRPMSPSLHPAPTPEEHAPIVEEATPDLVVSAVAEPPAEVRAESPPPAVVAEVPPPPQPTPTVAEAPSVPTAPRPTLPSRPPTLSSGRPPTIPSGRPPTLPGKTPSPGAPAAKPPLAKPNVTPAPRPLPPLPTSPVAAAPAPPKPTPAITPPKPALPTPPAAKPPEAPTAATPPKSNEPKMPEAPTAPTAPTPLKSNEPRMPQAPAAGTSPAEGSPRPAEGAAPKPLTPVGPNRPRDLNQPRAGSGSNQPNQPRRPRPTPGYVARPPAPLKAQQPKAEAKPQQPVQPPVQKPMQTSIPRELLLGSKGPLDIKALLNKPVVPVAPIVGDMEDDEETKDKKKKAGAGGIPGVIPGRDARHKERAKRQEERKGREHEKKLVLGEEDEDAMARAARRRARMVQKRIPGTVQPKSSKIVVQVPITVRSLSEAMGVRSGELMFKLRDHGINAMNLNLTVEPEMAELLALAFDKELEIKRPLTTEEHLIQNPKLPDNPEDLVPRAPVVTIMGHVDHGKTSLLDKIRHSNVTATEAGGITQVIRAWRVEHNGKPITFLDTPGHEAFTKMRARGANVTDIAVIVVAADDGVMPQTEEAILHAKAAGVSLIVAINKVDLPNANLNKTRQQLYGLDVLPDNMGGDVPFVETSAANGKGIDDLLESILLVAELKELKANPKKTAEGTCLEAEMDEQEGVQATLLVQSGTLRRGDVLVCGGTFGRVRAMYNDLGKPIDEAGPGMPCRVTGLDEVPNADDRFLVVPDLALGREIAEARKEKAHEGLTTRRTLSLDMLGEQKITELKVILKADFRGSVEAIKKELEKLQHDEIRVRVLSAAIGGITENDVNLALTSPQDTLIVGFNVVPDDNARRLAEERGISLREYSIIYNLTNDVKAAMEGRLKPEEKVVNLGRAMVRETFKISRVGTIAGCYVTQGTLERSAKIRVIRDGVVIYPPADRTAGLESLKRFKDDVRDVREGFECGLKVAGYDDIKVGDVIEAFRVEHVQRKLDS